MDEPVDQMDKQAAAKLHAGSALPDARERGTGGPPPAPMCATVERTRKSETATLIKLHAEQPTRGQRSSSTPAMCADNDEPSLDVDDVVARAVNAQRQFAEWDERRVDELLAQVAGSVIMAADDLARRTTHETGMGNARDKFIKISFATHTVQRYLEGKIAAGILSPDERSDIVEIASPVGVVFGLIPVTNPVATLAFKSLIALKGRNALIASCHHGARNVGRHTATLIAEALRHHGAPADLVQFTAGGDRVQTGRFMRHPDVSMILATGGTEHG